MPGLQERKANVSINAVHPGIVKTGIIRDHKGFLTGMHAQPYFTSNSYIYIHTHICEVVNYFNLIY